MFTTFSEFDTFNMYSVITDNFESRHVQWITKYFH